MRGARVENEDRALLYQLVRATLARLNAPIVSLVVGSK